MRIQLEVDQTGKSLIQGLMESIGAGTYKELFNNCLTLLAWAVRQRVEGRTIASVDADNKNYRELQMPALENAASQRSAAVGGVAHSGGAG